MLWQQAVLVFDTLKSGVWIDLAILNLYLYYRWTREPHCPIRYITHDVMGNWHGVGSAPYTARMETYTIPAFRHNYGLPSVGDLPVVPLMFACLHRNHFFLVLMDHANHRIWVIGRSSRSPANKRVASDRWSEWDGPEVYKHICCLHGWDAGDTDLVRTYSVVLPQDGVNCGPVAICTALWLFKHGLQLNADDVLSLPPPICPHLIRLAVLLEVSRMVSICKTDFERLREDSPLEWNLDSNPTGQPNMEWEIIEEVRDILPHILPNRVIHHPAYTSLHAAITLCSDCSAAGPLYTAYMRVLQDGGHEGPDLMDVDDPIPKMAVQGGLCTTRRVCPLSSPDVNETGASPEPLDLVIGRIRRHHAKYKEIKDVSLSNPKRFPRLTEPLPLPPFYQETWIKHSDTFDDYHTGPTREEMLVENKQLGDIHAMYTMDPIATYIASSSWTRFADQGMRLLAGYAHMHYLREPWEVHAHILPCPRPAPHPSQYYHQLYQQRAQDEFLKKMRSTAAAFAGNPVLDFVTRVPPDIAFMGLEDMLQSYQEGNPACTENLDLFVRGFTPDQKLVCLDLERDSVDVPVQDILVDIDIDSIIWVTQTLRFKHGIDLAITPTVGKAPPIRKNNHVYVNILYPPTDQERFSGEREWVENITPLSIVPHTVFAKISDSSSPIYVLICFPRMLHRHEARGTWEALIPFEVQRMFWNEVLLPALRQNAEPGTEAYMPATVDENLLRAGSKDQRKGAHFKAKTVNIQPHVLTDLQATMREIIRDNPELDLYGSFYFVLDAKNLKLQTRMSLHDVKQASSPWSKLKLCQPCLDLDYMVDRRNGELHIDIAYSFTPNPEATRTNLVGLWRLDVLEDSFGAGGYTKGTLHNIASLSRYGALQAPMSRERSQLSHTVFRSAYNLQYEPIRSSDNVPYFANDGDAYEVNETYHTECNRRISVFRGNAQNTTYGVRDEYRIGGQALLSFLEGWQDKVSSLGCFRPCHSLLTYSSDQTVPCLQSNPLGQVPALVRVSRCTGRGPAVPPDPSQHAAASKLCHPDFAHLPPHP